MRAPPRGERWGPRRRGGRAALWAFAALVGGSCTSEPPPGAPLPQGAPVIEVTMREFAFEHTSQIPAGRVVFRVHNAGQTVHRLSLFPLAEDVPPIVEQLLGTQRRPITPFAGLFEQAPGQGGTFAVDLVAGQRYGFVCFVTDEGGSHALKGMASEFRARAPSPPG